MELSKLAKELKPSATLAITAKAKEMKAEGIDVIGFGAGEPDFDTPENIKNYAKRFIDNGFTKYTAAGGILELKESIIKRISEDYGVIYNSNEIFVGSGAKHVLYNLFQVLIDEGDEVRIGTDLGCFHMGGSAIVILTPESYPDGAKINIRPDIACSSLCEYEFKINLCEHLLQE